MKKIPNRSSDSSDAAQLRRRAEARLKEQTAAKGPPANKASLRRMQHELEVHQIELEMQNEELRQARAEIEALLAQYTDFYDFAPVGYLILDREGNIRQVNLIGARLIGCERSQLLERRFGLFITEGNRSAFEEYLKKIFASQAKERCEVTLWHECSEPCVVQIDSTRSADGQECRAVLVDITARTRAEEQLRESEERLRLFIEHAPAALAMFDRDMRYLTVSHRWICDYNLPDNLVGRWHYDVFPDLPERWKSAHRRGLAGEIVRVEEDRFERPDGTVQWARYEVRPWRAADGAIGGIVIFIEDITKRRQAEAALRKSEERFRTLVVASAEVVWNANPRGEPLGENLSWRKCTGQSLEEIRAGRWAEAVHPDDRAAVGEVVSRAFAEGVPYEVENRLRRFDGQWRHMIVRGVPIIEANGSVREWVGYCQDITERKQVEEQMNKQVKELRQWYEATLGREDRVRQLKGEVNELRKRLGEAPRYLSQETGPGAPPTASKP